ncbi:unnamed protein product [Ambrosiozyma monospora]|uniref:Unnamed protein product n=1 Tax=Ambrosiozyma monospora TaxID=43982 RepID=A0A9W6YN85_AMBMO|nr:unnamed protein product [Ambrosiozyma monospora]
MVDEDAEIEKMILAEIIRAKKVKDQEKLKAKNQKKKLLAMKKKGSTQIDDEPEFSDEVPDSDYYSDEIEIEESEEEKETNGKKVENETKKDNLSQIGYSLDKPSSNPAFKNMSLSDFFGQTLPSTGSNKNLDSLQVMNKMKEQSNGASMLDDSQVNDIPEEHDDQEDDSMDTTMPLQTQQTQPVGSFTQKMASIDEDYAAVGSGSDEDDLLEKKKFLLSSQNLLPDTQVDEEHHSGPASSFEDTPKRNRKDSFMNSLGDPASTSTVPINTGADSVRSTQDLNDSLGFFPRLRRSRKKIVESDDDEDDGNEADQSDSDSDNDDSDDEEEEEDEETKKLILAKLKEQKKLEEMKRIKKEREFKAKGLSKIMENEAEESEDEYKGLGGAEGEGSDKENSEDEKMLDDLTKITVNEDKMREVLAKNNIEFDNAMFKRVYKDLKTGGFRNRRAKDGAYEIELSDDEDQLFAQYYQRRRKAKEEAERLQNRTLATLSKDKKSKAFYETIMNPTKTTTSSFQFEDVVESDLNEDSSDSQEENPFLEKKAPVKEKSPDSVVPPPTEATATESITSAQPNQNSTTSSTTTSGTSFTTKKRKRLLTAAQIRSKISFIDEEDHVDYTAAPTVNLDGGDGNGFVSFSEDSDNDSVEELKAIREKSHIKLTSPTHYKKMRKLNAPSKSSHHHSRRSSKSKSSTTKPAATTTTPTKQNQPVTLDSSPIADISIISEQDISLDGAADGLSLLSKRTTSITESFRRQFGPNRTVMSATGKQLQEIKVTTSARPMSGSSGYLAVGVGEKKRFGFGSGSGSASGSGSESSSFASRSGSAMGSFGSFGKKSGSRNGSGLNTVVENVVGVGNGKVAKIQESLKVARKRGGLSGLFKSGFN